MGKVSGAYNSRYFVENPGKDAVRDDVVELAVAVIDFHDVRGNELDVGKLQRLDHRVALGDLDG